jgi:hypothetical protein
MLVAKGYSQQYGMNYEETFALVAKMITIHTCCCYSFFEPYLLMEMVYIPFKLKGGV